MATKLGLYQGACIKVGETAISTLSDDLDIRHALDVVYDLGAIDRCLEVVKPRFAAKTTALTGSASAGGITLAYTHTLPSDYVTIVGVYSDAELDQPVSRYIQDGNTLLCDYATVYLRYINNSVTETNFTTGFTHVVTSFLAREVAHKFDPDRYSDLDTELQAIVEQVSATEGEKEPTRRPAAEGSALSDAWRSIYNGALLILGQHKLPAGDTDHEHRVAMDTSVADGVVSAVMEDTLWRFGHSSTKIQYDVSVDPEWGHQYAHQKPADLLRLHQLYSDEYFRHPIRDFVDEGDYWYLEYDTIYVKYISTSWVTSPDAWPQYFARLISAQIAKDVAPVVSPGLIEHAENTYRARRDAAKNTDAMQSPPPVITEGNWTTSRFSYRDSNYSRGRP